MSAHAILASTSTLYGEKYLEYLLPYLEEFLKGKSEVLFIPYAQPSGISFDEYTSIAKTAFNKIAIQIKGIHKLDDPIKAIDNAEAIFTGGGNTFLLLKTLYDLNLMTVLKANIQSGTKYIGTSAGTNITGPTICTTNDMPIVYPPSFNALGIIPFNINPHYLDPIEGLKHKGESRETRINEFHKQKDTAVVGLREGSWIELVNNTAILKGNLNARIFKTEKVPEEISSGTDLLNIV